MCYDINALTLPGLVKSPYKQIGNWRNWSGISQDSKRLEIKEKSFYSWIYPIQEIYIVHFQKKKKKKKQKRNKTCN